MMTWIMQIVIASGLPGTGKEKNLESSHNNSGLDEWEKGQKKVNRWAWPQYLVEPPYIEGTSEENRIAI
jgi:hypothetical protein